MKKFYFPGCALNLLAQCSVSEIPQVQFPFEFESERPNGNSATKQLPNNDLSDLDLSNGQMAI